MGMIESGKRKSSQETIRSGDEESPTVAAKLKKEQIENGVKEKKTDTDLGLSKHHV